MLQETRVMMGMPITVAIADPAANAGDVGAIFDYFQTVDDRFSPFKETSETAAINRGLPEERWSGDMQTVAMLAEMTKRETEGYFNLTTPEGKFNPVGIVKGWAIKNAADLLRRAGYKNFFVDAGGDIEASGLNSHGEKWSIGIKNPFVQDEIVKTLFVTGQGVATSGTYIRGDHIYDPHTGQPMRDIVSLTIVGRDVCEADRFATGAFAMGKDAILFIERCPGLEGYMIEKNGIATMTSGFLKYTTK